MVYRWVPIETTGAELYSWLVVLLAGCCSVAHWGLLWISASERWFGVNPIAAFGTFSFYWFLGLCILARFGFAYRAKPFSLLCSAFCGIAFTGQMLIDIYLWCECVAAV
jgi:hypothetical protein